ncbi:antichymotrypsin-2-like [Epargyreus clarus]|uniref:antichymotrypsin-2-like n=1 Tax=Epargyreus clarus TaxID=520877 RepID=UPI003C2E70A2
MASAIQKNATIMKTLLLTLFALVAITTAEDVGIEKILHNGNNRFTARMFYEVAKENKEKSFVLSAFSVLTPLAQLALASEGVSHEELLNAIGFTDAKTITEIFSLIDEKDNSIKGVQLKKASKVYIATGLKIHEEFAKVSKSVFHSEIANIDFNDSENAANEINAWVEDQTNHRIKKLVKPGDLEASIALLVNALYFKGTWKYRFDESSTEIKDFYVTKTKTTKVSMMQKTVFSSYGYSKKLRSKILELPYAGDQASLLIVLPHEVEYIGSLIELLRDPKVLEEETKEMLEVKVEVSVPKFKIETTTKLMEVLTNMNITKIFGSEAKLNKLLENRKEIHISGAVQKAFIEVNEEGAEAAAANVFYVMYSEPLVEPLKNEFIADHPFVFYLKAHNDIIFNGVFYGS